LVHSLSKLSNSITPTKISTIGMKSTPKIGTAGEHRFTVAQENAITFASDGMPAVLSTPNLISLMERTAREAIAPFLELDERSVGVEIELRHLAPTPVGAQVTVTTRVIGSSGRYVDFQVEARDSHELIARGVHKRAIIRTGAFTKRVQSKAN
jgi:predicted thioesterase